MLQDDEVLYSWAGEEVTKAEFSRRREMSESILFRALGRTVNSDAVVRYMREQGTLEGLSPHCGTVKPGKSLADYEKGGQPAERIVNLISLDYAGRWKFFTAAKELDKKSPFRTGVL
jgi:hypothetical protein